MTYPCGGGETVVSQMKLGYMELRLGLTSEEDYQECSSCWGKKKKTQERKNITDEICWGFHGGTKVSWQFHIRISLARAQLSCFSLPRVIILLESVGLMWSRCLFQYSQLTSASTRQFISASWCTCLYDRLVTNAKDHKMEKKKSCLN